MRRCGGGGLAVAGLGEPFGGELADGLQQPVAQGSPGWLGHDQALVHQRAEQVGDVERLDVAEAAHRLGGVQIEALGEHRQAPQQRLLGAVEQRIGPVDGRPQGLLALQGGAASPGEQAEALVEAVVQARQRQRAQPGGGQLDGQRHPVQPPADRHHQRAGLLVHGAGRRPALGPGRRTARPHRRTPAPRSRRRRVRAATATAPGRWSRRRCRAARGWWPADAPAGSAARSASAVLAQAPIRCSQLSSTIRTSWGARASSSVSRTGRPGCPAIPSASEMAGATASSSVTAASSTSQTPSPDPSSSSAATCRPSLVLPDPPAPVSVTRRQDSDQRPDLGQLPVAADERRQLGREIVRQRRVAQRAQRRELGLQARRVQLEDLFRAAQVLQPVHAEIGRAPRPAEASRAPGRPPSPTPAPAPRTRPRPPGRRDGHPGPPGRSPSCAASPVCTPIRTRTCSPAGQACASRARCISSTAATHARGEENTAKNPSPWVSISLPSCAASADRISAW